MRICETGIVFAPLDKLEIQQNKKDGSGTEIYIAVPDRNCDICCFGSICEAETMQRHCIDTHFLFCGTVGAEG